MEARGIKANASYHVLSALFMHYFCLMKCPRISDFLRKLFAMAERETAITLGVDLGIFSRGKIGDIVPLLNGSPGPKIFLNVVC